LRLALQTQHIYLHRKDHDRNETRKQKEHVVSDTHLEFTLTKNFNGLPLVVIESSIGNGADASPAQIRAIAAALRMAADQAEARNTKVQFSPRCISIDLNDHSQASESVTKKSASPPPFSLSHASLSNPNRLLDTLLLKLQIRNNAALSRLLDVAAPVLSNIRHGRSSVGPSLLLRMHDVSGISIRELKALLDQDAAK
jgi:hypothetical protein